MPKIYPEYSETFSWAVKLQILSLLPYSLILDGGEFGFYYACVMAIFWLLAWALAVYYPRPPGILQVLLALAPQILFWLLLFILSRL